MAKLTTPYDVFENWCDNKNREDGTCGLGIGKTMKRNESPYKLYAVDLLNTEILKEKIKNIGKLYYKTSVTSDTEQIRLQHEIDDFNEALTKLSWEIRNYDYLTNYDNLIFEGSQGILLDMDHGVFPNVTYSNTTTKNAHDILDKLGVEDREVYYVTRAYSTRHGSGPFVEEEVHLINNEGEINVFNEYQKEFKIANIDYDKLNYALDIDDIYSNGKVTNKNLVVTCLDQLEEFKFKYTNLATPFKKLFESYSPDSKDFKLKQTNYFKNN